MKQQHSGQWPVTEPADLAAIEGMSATSDAPGLDELYVRRAQEKALHEMVLDSIRHDLEQQPTGPSAQAKARIWCAHVLAIADEVAQAKRRAA